MSTTALVRSTSGTSTSLAAPRTPQKPALPSTVSTTTATQPKPTSTPQTYSAPAKPSTPQQQLSPAPSTPGRWQHPRMDEVVRRQNRTRFDQSNVFSLKYNLALLVASSISIPILNWLYVNTPSPSHKAITNTNTSLPISRILTNHQYTTYTLLALRLFFLLNIGLACAPLLRKPDACEDIPLTPSQRNLLGLPPMSRPATPQEREQYVTPPRYSRSNTPSSRGSNGGVRPGGGSPLSGVPSAWRSPSGSPLPTGSLHVRQGSGTRKLSYNSNRSSPLSISEFDAIGGSVNTPTKRDPQHRASVGLNSKWLYEKGKAGSGVQMSGSGWGSGGLDWS